MIYIFEEKSKYFMLDTVGGAFFEIQGEHWNILKKYVSMDSTLTTEDVAKIYEDYKEDIENKQFIQSLEKLYQLGYILKDEEVNLELLKKWKIPSVGSIIFHITDQCNFKCVYCYEHSNQELKDCSTKSIDIDKIYDALDLFLKHNNNKNINISFFGGEATLYPNLIREAVKLCNQKITSLGKTVSYSLTTNASLLTSDFIDFLSSEKFSLVVSCDGPKEIQKKQRVPKVGDDSFTKVHNNSKLLIKKMNTNTITVRATTTNISMNLSSIFNYFLDMGFINISIEPAILPVKSPYAIDEDELIKAYEDLAETYYIVKKARPEVRFYLFEQIIKRIRKPQPTIRQCGLGSGIAAVAPDGNIYPCQRFVGYKEMVLGNVKNGIQNQDLRDELVELTIFKKDDCNNCWAKIICGGGCPAESYELFADFSKTNGFKCRVMKKLIELSVWIYYNCYDIYNKDSEICTNYEECR